MSRQESSSSSTLTREQVLAALGALSEELGRRGVTGEICRFGGSAMVIAFRARISTKDVDALFQPATIIRDIARGISAEQHLPPDWLNDGVKGFLSDRHETTAAGLPQYSANRISVKTQYLVEGLFEEGKI